MGLGYRAFHCVKRYAVLFHFSAMLSILFSIVSLTSQRGWARGRRDRIGCSPYPTDRTAFYTHQLRHLSAAVARAKRGPTTLSSCLCQFQPTYTHATSRFLRPCSSCCLYLHFYACRHRWGNWPCGKSTTTRDVTTLHLSIAIPGDSWWFIYASTVTYLVFRR